MYTNIYVYKYPKFSSAKEHFSSMISSNTTLCLSKKGGGGKKNQKNISWNQKHKEAESKMQMPRPKFQQVASCWLLRLKKMKG